MHKTKENLARPSKNNDQDIRDAVETANEENYEAVGGETSTEGVGRGRRRWRAALTEKLKTPQTAH